MKNPDALKSALAEVWPDPQERSVRTLDLFTGLAEGGRFVTVADLLRAVGIPESRVWDVVSVAAEALDEDAGEVFQALYEPEEGFDE